MKEVAIIHFIVEEDRNRHQEEMTMRSGLYSFVMNDRQGGER